MSSTEDKREALARMEANLDSMGGRNIPLAESIDALRADIEADAEECAQCGEDVNASPVRNKDRRPFCSPECRVQHDERDA